LSSKPKEKYTIKQVEELTVEKPSNSKFRDIEGEVIGKLTILKYAGRVGKAPMWFTRCDCGNIVQLNSHTIIDGRASSCGCSFLAAQRSKARTEVQYRKDITKASESLRIEELVDTRTKTINQFHCSKCDTSFKSNLERIQRGAVACRCAKTFYQYTQEDREDTVVGICNERGYTFLGWLKGFKNNKSYVTLKCNKDGHLWDIQLNNLLQGCGCSVCAKYGFNPDVPNYFYLQKLDNKYIKFGITKNDPHKRLRQQDLRSVFTHELIYTKLFDKGTDALALENNIKALGDGVWFY
jgi:hypothetical protein